MTKEWQKELQGATAVAIRVVADEQELRTTWMTHNTALIDEQSITDASPGESVSTRDQRPTDPCFCGN